MIAAEPLLIEPPATPDDLIRANCKAELINGKVVRMMAVGFLPNRVAGMIHYFLLQHEIRTGAGFAFTDGMEFTVTGLYSCRQSFSPDVSFYTGPQPKRTMRYIEGPPTFAVEVRSEGDYGPASESEMTAKRVDYFEAGTVVVWDVDTQRGLINCYRKHAPLVPEIFSSGQIIDAEPAVPGLRISVDEIFRK